MVEATKKLTMIAPEVDPSIHVVWYFMSEYIKALSINI